MGDKSLLGKGPGNYQKQSSLDTIPYFPQEKWAGETEILQALSVGEGITACSESSSCCNELLRTHSVQKEYVLQIPHVPENRGCDAGSSACSYMLLYWSPLPFFSLEGPQGPSLTQISPPLCEFSVLGEAAAPTEQPGVTSAGTGN